ncbi:MAG: Ig-like domain-containing protein, partial [Acidobacteriota bacterium]
ALDGADITGSLTVTDTGATGTAPSALVEGAHTLQASISDYDGNSVQAQSSFTVQAAGDTTPPTITITGVTDGSWTNADVAAQVSVADPHLDPGSVTIALNGMAYASGTPVTADGYYVLSVSAADTFGNAAQAAVSFAVDKTPPGISVSSPADNGVVNATPVTLTGYIQDAHPETLTVNGSAVGSPGQSSFSAPVALTEGANVITLTATDRAGNSSSLAWHVMLKTTAPTVTVTSPLDGLVTRQMEAAVSGTVSADAVMVDVNGQPASLANGTFAAQHVPLTEGANTLTATARDAAGNAAAAAVHVTRDTQAPVIAFTAPSDGTSTAGSSVTVSGSVADSSSVSATLNGSPLALNGGAFSATVQLAPGSNLIQVTATDLPGNSAQAGRTVVREEGNLAVASITPSDGAQEISSASPVAVTFSRSVNKATVTASTFVVTAAGQALTGAFVGEGGAITFLPSSPFPEGAAVTINLTGGIQDTAGNALTPFASSFTVLGGTGGPVGLALTLDAYPSLTNQTSVTLTGESSAGATVTITGGSAPITATAGTDGTFTTSLPLATNTLNAFSAQASLSGQTSSAQPVTIIQDALAPSVLDCSLDGGTLTVDFSEAVAEATLTPSNVTLTVNGTSVPWSASVDGSGTRLLLTPDSSIGSNPVSLKLSIGVTDLAGNGLATSFAKAFQGATAGDAFIEGEVYSDRTGLPLAGVSVSLAGGGSSVTSGAMGSWALPGPEGQAVVYLSAAGYSDAYRNTLLTSGQIEAVLDARLAPLSTEQRTLPAAGGSGTFTSGVTVTAPAGGFASDASATATALSGQTLPLPLPPGFSPLAAWRLDISQTPTAPLTLMLPRPTGTSGNLPAALFDASQQEWIGLAPAADAGGGLTVVLPTPVSLGPTAMTVVLLRLDQSPSEPSAVVEGQALSGVSAATLQTATATLVTDPSTILPDQKATATVTITPPSAASSGAPCSVTFTESLDTTDGTTHAFSPYTADLLAYQDPSTPAHLKVLFPVSPFPGIDVLTLLQGKIHLEVGPYSPGAVGGGIVGTNGGSVDGSGGIRAELPSGAVGGSVPVQVLPVSQGSLLVPVPDGFAYVGGIELRLGGAGLNGPAILSLDEGSLGVPVASGDLVLLVKADTLSGVSVLTAVDAAVLSNGRLATCSGA